MSSSRVAFGTRALVLCALWVLCAPLLVGCGDKVKAGKPEAAAKKGGPQAFPVEVVPVGTRDVQRVVPAVGSVDAFERVQVTARVSGVIERVRFTEGQDVKSGQLLVEIEPKRYQVAVRSAKAALDRVRASRAEASAGLARREQAVATSPGLIPAEEIETWRTRESLAAAEQAEAQARFDEASLNLRDAYVRAPTKGTIETRSAQTGQFAQPGVVLATLVRRDPLLLRFQVAEADASKMQRTQVVTFRVQGDTTDYRATVTHVAALADTTTRMVPITAEIDAAQRDALRPGAFAEVSAAFGSVTNTPVVPEIAVRPTERGFVAFVVEEQDGVTHARERLVELGMHTRDGFVEVRQGLTVGEQLVVRGGEALKEGALVRVRHDPDRPLAEGAPGQGSLGQGSVGQGSTP